MALGRLGLPDAKLGGEERTGTAALDLLCRGPCHTLALAVKVSCLSLRRHAALLPLSYTPLWIRSSCEITHPPSPPSWLRPPRAPRRRSELEHTGLGVIWPGCCPQTHPATPSRRTGLSDPRASAGSWLPPSCQEVCSQIVPSAGVTLMSPLPHLSSRSVFSQLKGHILGEVVSDPSTRSHRSRTSSQGSLPSSFMT